MTNNADFERKMAFIADQQAKFAIGMRELRDLHAETEKAHAETEKAVAEAEAIVGRLAYATLEGFKDTNAKINALVDSQIRYEHHIQELKDIFKELGLKILDRLSRPTGT